MKRNNLRILSIFLGIFLILLITGNIIYPELFSSPSLSILKTIILQSFLFFCGLYLSKLKLKELMPNISIKFILRIIGLYVLTMTFIIIAFIFLILLDVRPDTYLVYQKANMLGWWFIILGVLVAPVTEEIFFRGALVPRIGIILSAILFALSHVMYGSIYEVIAALIFGVLLGWVYKRWGIGNSIALHLLINTISIIGLIVIKYFTGYHTPLLCFL